ncbi:glycosyltransferase family 1 protein [Ruegeria sp. 6PALISEP08]|uniref:glycosyltransferase family 4 protein n=1 Tax=Ruegeria sp. 6PALISEP08 TaxID=1225660 RepID=UPI00067F6B9F|nr:glycosyltransferase family 1 protein [Ruegeria sp. 6PALISEP08]
MTGHRVPWVIDASPLWEVQYTGISNVTYEIVRRAVADPDAEVHILAVDHVIPRALVDQCIAERSGKSLQAAVPRLPKAKKIKDILRGQGRFDGTVGLFLNARPLEKLFDWEAMMFYDFSPLLTPECHTSHTVEYHSKGISQQVSICDHMFCISEATARDLNWVFDVPRDDITVCLLGHSTDEIAYRAARSLLGEAEVEPFLLMLGTIEPRKNIGLVLEWLSTHSDVLDTYRVVFAGRQGWGPDLQSQIKHWGLEDAVQSGRIVYMDYVSEAQKNALLVGASALLYPSLFEGFGLPALEAMGFDLPVLSTVSTSLPEVLGDTGYYFDPYSSTSLDVAFRRFVADAKSGALEEVVEAARARAQTFDYDKTYKLVRGRLAQAARGIA